jgi:hypothetical protein
MPQANSTVSRPRLTSPSASDKTLPCSEVTMAASSLRWALTSSRKRKRISVRFASGVARQPGKAWHAADTAPSTSPAVPKPTSRVCSPVAGSNTGPHRPEELATGRPPIQWGIRSMGPP